MSPTTSMPTPTPTPPTIVQRTVGMSVTITSEFNIIFDLTGDHITYSTTLSSDMALGLSRHLRRTAIVAQARGR